MYWVALPAIYSPPGLPDGTEILLIIGRVNNEVEREAKLMGAGSWYSNGIGVKALLVSAIEALLFVACAKCGRHAWHYPRAPRQIDQCLCGPLEFRDQRRN